MSQPILYLYPGRDNMPSPSPPCTKVALALKYLKIEHQVKRVGGDARRVSPTGRLPVLEMGGQKIADSVEILDALEAKGGDIRLSPEDPRERARDRVWEKFSNEHLYWRLVYLRWLVPENKARTCKVLLAGLPAIARWIVPMIAVREARSRAVGQGIGKQPLERVHKDYSKALTTYVEGLGEGPFLEQRDQPSRADFAAAALLAQFAYQGITPWAGAELLKQQALVDYIGRVFEACDLPAPTLTA